MNRPKAPLDDPAAACEYLLHMRPYPYQEEIFKKALDPNVRRLTIRATTRAGKSKALAALAILKATFSKNKRIGIIAPTHPKTRIIMNYIAEMLADNPAFDSVVMVETEGLTRLERLRKEVSKNRITFRTGCSIESKSVDLDKRGFGVMGWAYDFIVCFPYNTKIMTDVGEIEIGKIVELGLRPKILSKNREGKLEFKEIGKTYKNVGKEQVVISTTLHKLNSTPNHPVYVRGKGFIPASQIQKGDWLGVLG